MISYNGFEFPPAYTHFEAQIETIYDASGRHRTGLKHYLWVRSHAMRASFGETNNSEAMGSVKSLLTEPGGPLIIEDEGFGLPLYVNVTSNPFSKWDSDSGPKPRVIRWSPVGHTNVAEIIWDCEFTIPPCDWNTEFPMVESVSYRVGFSINAKGYTTRTASGVITIQQLRINGVDGDAEDGIWQSADDYREFFTLARLPNAERTQTFNLSEDKKRLEFSITDTEIESPSAYPANIIKINAPMRMRVRYPNQEANNNQQHFSVQMELAPTAPRVYAWELFQTLFNIRIQGYRDEDHELIITDIDLSEDWFTNSFAFHVSFTVPGLAFNKLLETGGWFRTVETNTWQEWADSDGIAESMSRRGIAGIRHGNDEISNDQDPAVTPCSARRSITVTHTAEIPAPGQVSLASLCNRRPSPEKSYLKFKHIKIEAPQTNTAAFASYGDPGVEEAEWSWSQTGAEARRPAYRISPTADHQVEVAQSPAVQVYYWKGVAERVGYEIPRPVPPDIDGKTATIIGDPQIMHRQLGMLFCHPVYQCAWNMALLVTETPEELGNDDPTGLNSGEDDDDEGEA